MSREVARNPSTESIISNQAGISLFIAQRKTNQKKKCSPSSITQRNPPTRNLACKSRQRSSQGTTRDLEQSYKLFFFISSLPLKL